MLQEKKTHKLTEDQKCLIIADYLEGKRGEYFRETYDTSPTYVRTLVVRSGFGKRGEKKPGPVKRVARKDRDWLIVSEKLPGKVRIHGFHSREASRKAQAERRALQRNIRKAIKILFRRNRLTSLRSVLALIEEHVS